MVLKEDVVSEAVEISKAVFSSGGEDFEYEYGGENTDYDIVEDLKIRIDNKMIELGYGLPQLSEWPSFNDMGMEAEDSAEILYSLEEGYSLEDLAAATDLPETYVDEILSVFEEASVIETSVKEKVTEYFYGEKFFPYQEILSEAEALLEEEQVEDSTVESEREDVSQQEEFQDSSKGREHERNGSEEDMSHQQIMESLGDRGQGDFEETLSQSQDGGIESRDHADTET